jgi:hypothetical protein
MTEIASRTSQTVYWRGKTFLLTRYDVCLTVKEAVMTRVQQFHRRIAALFVVSLAWVALVVSMYATTA